MNDVILSLLYPHISSDPTIIDKKKTLPPTGDQNTPKEHARESLLSVWMLPSTGYNAKHCSCSSALICIVIGYI